MIRMVDDLSRNNEGSFPKVGTNLMTCFKDHSSRQKRKYIDIENKQVSIYDIKNISSGRLEDAK